MPAASIKDTGLWKEETVSEYDARTEVARLKACASSPSSHLNDLLLEQAEQQIDLHWWKRKEERLRKAEAIRQKQIEEQKLVEAIDEEERRILAKYRMLPEQRSKKLSSLEKAMEKQMQIEMKRYKERLAEVEKLEADERRRRDLEYDYEEIIDLPLTKQILSFAEMDLKTSEIKRILLQREIEFDENEYERICKILGKMGKVRR